MSRSIQVWEYKVTTWKPDPNPVPRWSGKNLQDKLNELGKDSWELVSVDWWDKEPGATVVLKRHQ